jgi:hypothetical protein
MRFSYLVIYSSFMSILRASPGKSHDKTLNRDGCNFIAVAITQRFLNLWRFAEPLIELSMQVRALNQTERFFFWEAARPPF